MSRRQEPSQRARMLAACVAVLGLSACGEAPPTPVGPPQPGGPRPSGAVATDALGDRPLLGAPKPFIPPSPEIFKGPGGLTIWLVERHSLPIVSASIVVPTGSAADPADKSGLAYVAADMLDEGAGTRSAVELSSAVNDLGATLSTGAQADSSAATVTVLKKNFAPAFAILGDVVARPRFDPKEWKRVSELWENGLKKRADDPASVSRVVGSAALYGPRTPYGHPSDGLLATAKKIDLSAAKAFYSANWRPDRALLVVAGDVTRDEVLRAVETSLGRWKAQGNPPPAVDVSQLAPAAKRPRLILVDRPEAPQAVIAVVREGVAASDPRAPMLDLVNTAIGGSFTSRLNQNLREDHGWSYGARSGFSEVRGQGMFVARAAVLTDATGAALKETLSELTKMAASGLTPDELGKVLAQDRADLVQTYETVGGVARRLGSLAALGLPSTFDASASRARQAAKLPDLAQLAAAHVDPKGATVVVVGPRAQVGPQLAALGLGEPELWDAEGNPLPPVSEQAKAAPSKPAKAF